MKKMYLLIAVLLVSLISGCSAAPVLNSDQETVLLLHGFGRSKVAVRVLEESIREQGFNVVAIGYSSLVQNMEGIQQEVESKIDYALSTIPQRKVHFVGHSLGGLLVRSYLGNNHIERLGNVVVMGSPNKGTRVVEFIKDEWYFSLLGPAAMSLSSEGSTFLDSLKKPYYNLGVIAGNAENPKYEALLPGPDDGLVTVDSAKVEGMSDFVLLPVSHTQMRYDEYVAQQVIHFLQNGKFNHSDVVPMVSVAN